MICWCLVWCLHNIYIYISTAGLGPGIFIELNFPVIFIFLSNVPGRKKSYKRTTSSGTEYSSVEETAISFYLEENVYTQGIHCENSLLSTAFYIFFWDLIYETHVPNTFISNIQKFPLDFFSTDFYNNRKNKIDARLSQIESLTSKEELKSYIFYTFDKYSDQFDVIFSSEMIDVDFLTLFVECVGNKLLGAVFRRFLKNFKVYRSGLPDLFLWNPEKKKVWITTVIFNNLLNL